MEAQECGVCHDSIDEAEFNFDTWNCEACQQVVDDEESEAGNE